MSRSNPDSGREGKEGCDASRAGSAGDDLVAGTAGAGAATGATLLVGPLGALVGPTVAVGVKRLLQRFRVDRTLERVVSDFAERGLSGRQQERVERAYRIAAERIVERLKGGSGLRADGFFLDDNEEGPPAEGVLEHALAAAQEAHEQRKAKRLGELFAFVAFRADVAPGQAHRLIALAQRLTYRQLLWLGVLAEAGTRREGILPDWRPSGAFTVREMAVVSELKELADVGLVLRDDRRPISTYADVDLRHLETALEGNLLVEAMDLQSAESEDWAEITDALRRLGTLDVNDGSTRLDAVGLPGDPPGTRVKLEYRTVSFTPSPGVVTDDHP